MVMILTLAYDRVMFHFPGAIQTTASSGITNSWGYIITIMTSHLSCMRIGRPSAVDFSMRDGW